ncbi:MAG: MerR family transcriptional regulator [Rikenellaceae bacterium]|nr:MerR family transcriptional regulator [Rikenellaceae bacterium]MDE7355452.1 MerR family transcriptional regulator [Rikenellaceae bacterium]
MNNESDNQERIYYTVSEVADMFSLTPTVLRYWDKYFPQLKPHKNKKGNRLFTPEDIVTLKRIHHLTKDLGMKLEAVARELNTPSDGFEKREEMRERLLFLKSTFEAVNFELANFDKRNKELVVWSSDDNDSAPSVDAAQSAAAHSVPVESALDQVRDDAGQIRPVPESLPRDIILQHPDIQSDVNSFQVAYNVPDVTADKVSEFHEKGVPLFVLD